MKSILKVVLCITFLIAFISTSAMATIVASSATQLNAEENLWQIDYSISDYDAATAHGLDIYFDYGDYENIVLISSESDWSADVCQPDIILTTEEDGMLDIYTEAYTSGLLSADFTVTVNWFGQGTPSSQAFEIYDANYDVIATGTTSAVPLPGSLLLFFSGLPYLCHLRKKK